MIQEFDLLDEVCFSKYAQKYYEIISVNKKILGYFYDIKEVSENEYIEILEDVPQEKLLPYKRMKSKYFSFGQTHIHSFNGYILDKNCLVKIIAENDHTKIMCDNFNVNWTEEYGDEILNDLHLFPRGIYNLTDNKWEENVKKSTEDIKIGTKLFYIKKDKIRELEIKKIELNSCGKDVHLIYCEYHQPILWKGDVLYNTFLGKVFLDEQEAIKHLKTKYVEMITNYEKYILGDTERF